MFRQLVTMENKQTTRKGGNLLLEKANTISKIAINFNHYRANSNSSKLQLRAIPLKRNQPTKTMSKLQLLRSLSTQLLRKKISKFLTKIFDNPGS